MNNIHFTVGPSQVYPTVTAHIQQALDTNILSLSHRSEAFKTLFAETDERLRLLLDIPIDHHIVFLPSATEAMERILQGVVREESVHVATGAFGKKFAEIARALQKKPTTLSLDVDSQAAPIAVNETTELICFTQNETSNGSWIPLELIYQTYEQYPDALIALDVVSSAPYVPLDFRKTDLVFFSVQKGFGLPAGLGVLVVSPRAYAKAKQLEQEGLSVGSYHSLVSLVEQANKHQTPTTPNVFGLYLFHKILGDFLSEGIETIRRKTDEKAALLYDFFEKQDRYEPVVQNPSLRSPVVIVTHAEDTQLIHTKLKEKDIIVGKGYGEHKENHLRIANFPAHSPDHVRQLLEVLK